MSLSLNVGSKIRPDREKVLSFAEERAVKEKIKTLEAELGGTEVQQGLSYTPRDPAILKKHLERLKQIESSGSAQRYEGNERREAEVEIRRIEQMIAKKWGGRIPTFDEYWVKPTAGIRFLKMRDTIVRLNKDREYAELIRRWKSLKRRMEPDDELSDNVLNLFPQ
jgi:hypothetical protein